MRLKRGSTVLWSSNSAGSPYGDVGTSLYGVRDQRALSPIYVETPAAGTYTYAIEITFSNSGGISTSINVPPSAIVITEIKR